MENLLCRHTIPSVEMNSPCGKEKQKQKKRKKVLYFGIIVQFKNCLWKYHA
jgi:hypothetical protein